MSKQFRTPTRTADGQTSGEVETKTVLPDEFLQRLGFGTGPADLETLCSIDGDFRTTLEELLRIALLCDEGGGATVLTSETLSLRL